MHGSIILRLRRSESSSGGSYISLSYLGLGIEREEITCLCSSTAKGSGEEQILLWVQYIIHKRKSEKKANLKARLHVFPLFSYKSHGFNYFFVFFP